MPFATINPATEEILKEYEFITDNELQEKLHLANESFASWHLSGFEKRRMLMHKAADMLLSHLDDLALTITLEMGKPIAQSKAEIKKSASACRFYADNAEVFLSDKIYHTDYSYSHAVYEPMGIIYAIMPWNFPYWQVFRCAVPAIMAGNVVVLKHAQNVPECARKIEEVFEKAGFPEGVFTNLVIDHRQSDKVISFRGVQGVSVTGSERAGEEVAGLAGKNLKKTVLELGGSDPFIVLSDADIKKAVAVAVQARTQNTGQSCIAAKRFIVEDRVSEEFIDGFVSQMMKLKVGNPTEAETEVGPLARKDLVETLDRQIKETVKHGGKILTGGSRIEGKGFFYEPTVITNIGKESPAYKEELFGPCASIFVVDSEEEAIRIANDTTFGLGSSLWTRNEAKGLELSKYLQAGSVYINTMVKSDPSIPFGGIKRSGYGRELSDVGIHEFVNIKTVVIN